MDQQLVSAPRADLQIGSRSTDNQWVVVAILDSGQRLANTGRDASGAASN